MIKVLHVLMLIKFSSTSLPRQLTSIKMENGSNYEDEAKSLKLYLVVTNLDLAPREEEPIIYTNLSAYSNI